MGQHVRRRETLLRHLRDPVYANGYALVLNAGLASLFGFAFWLVAARRFPADALGVGAAVVSAATLAALVGKAGFDAAIIRYAPSASARGLRRLLVVSTLATLILTLAVSLVVLVLAASGVPALAVLAQPAYALGFAALAMGTGVAWILDAYFISDQRGVLVLARNLAFNGVKLIVPLVLAVSLAGRAVPLAWGVGLAASLVVAFTLLPARVRAHAPVAATPVRRAEVLRYAMRNYALNLSEFLPGLLLPLIVLAALGAEANAHFYLAWTLATVGFLASKAIAQSAFAALVRDKRPQDAVRKGALLSAALLGPGALVLYLFPGFVLGFFGAQYGAHGAGLLRLLALSVAPVAAANLYLSYLKARADGWELTLLPAAGLVAIVASAPLALRVAGLEGVGWLWLAVQGVIGAYATLRLMVIMRRNHNENARIALRRHPHQG